MLQLLYKRSQSLKADVLSGLTVALALVPEAVAFAFVAGVDPLVGLYAAFMVGLITATIGGRPGMISGATGALAVVMSASGACPAENEARRALWTTSWASANRVHRVGTIDHDEAPVVHNVPVDEIESDSNDLRDAANNAIIPASDLRSNASRLWPRDRGGPC